MKRKQESLPENESKEEKGERERKRVEEDKM